MTYNVTVNTTDRATVEAKQKMAAVGNTGEKIVQRVIKELYKGDYELFLDHYARDGDGKIVNSERWDGAVCEVKTQTPYVRMDSVSFRPNQFYKILKQDVIFFVVFNPRDVPGYAYGNKVYALENPKQYKDDFKLYSIKTGEEKYAFSLKHAGMEPIYNLTPEQVSLLQRDTSSQGYYQYAKKGY